MDATQLCYLVAIIIALVFLIWGFMEIMKKRTHAEKASSDVISRQIRGFGWIMLSQIVLIVAFMFCQGFSESLRGFGGKVRQMGRF